MLNTPTSSARTASASTAGQEPGSLIDVLSIVEHPAFQSFYDELLKRRLAGTTGDDTDDTSSTGDVMAAELREGFEKFDFGIPFILREADELRGHTMDGWRCPRSRP
jgi:type III restriction enzyme